MKTSLILVIFIYAISAQAAPSKRTSGNQGCEPGDVFYDGSCYFVSDEFKVWDDARAACQALNDGDLSVLESQAEYDFVFDDLLSGESHPFFWVGGQGEDKTSFTWLDGSSVPLSFFSEKQAPPPAGLGCLEIVLIPLPKRIGLNDWHCNNTVGEPTKYVCEYEPLCREGYVLNDNSCYFVSQVAKTWDDSQAACQSDDAELAILDDQAEFDYVLFDLLGGVQATYDFFWIGGQGQDKTTYFWTDGNPVPVSFFAEIQATPPAGLGCLEIVLLEQPRRFGLNDWHCNNTVGEPTRYVCEYQLE